MLISHPLRTLSMEMGYGRDKVLQLPLALFMYRGVSRYLTLFTSIVVDDSL